MKRNEHVVEEIRFYYKGYPCVILFMDMGHRCGYVGLLEKDIIGLDFNDISCHGGITYVDNHLQLQDDIGLLWIGFDTAHSCDARDIDKMREYFGDESVDYCSAQIIEATHLSVKVRSLDFCIEECKGIVDQIIKMKGEKNMAVTTNKTKADLMKEIKQKNSEIQELKEEIENLERYKQYADMANEMKAMQDNYVNAGFSEDQAFTLTLKALEVAGAMVAKPRLF